MLLVNGRDNTNNVVKPVYYKLGICSFCGYKLTFLEKRKKTKDGRIICSKCGAEYSNKNKVY